MRKAVPRPRKAPPGSASREVSPVSRAWERGAPGCWWSRTGCPRSWPLLPGGRFCHKKRCQNSRKRLNVAQTLKRRRNPRNRRTHLRTSRVSLFLFISFALISALSLTDRFSTAIATRRGRTSAFPSTPRSTEYRVTVVVRGDERCDRNTHFKIRKIYRQC